MLLIEARSLLYGKVYEVTVQMFSRPARSRERVRPCVRWGQPLTGVTLACLQSLGACAVHRREVVLQDVARIQPNKAWSIIDA